MLCKRNNHLQTPYIEEILTAADGEGQQCRAAPACTASTELETKGSLEISALTKLKLLIDNRVNQIGNSDRLMKINPSYDLHLNLSSNSLPFWKVFLLLNKFIALLQHVL